MAKLMDYKGVGDFNPRKKSHRERSPRRHYINPISVLSPRRKFVRTKSQAVIYIAILLLIFIVAIVKHMWAVAEVLAFIVVTTAILYFGYHWLLSKIHRIRLHTPSYTPSYTDTKVRLNIPTSIRQQVYARARGKCERPRCLYSGKLHIHHIDENPSNNSPSNLLAVCPNCHSHIHDGAFSMDAQRSWITA